MAVAKTAPGKGTNDKLGTGRRKTSVARVRVRGGQGVITINERPLENYFANVQQRADVMAPLAAAGMAGNVDVVVTVHGGGPTSQSGAIKLGIARALIQYDSATEEPLRHESLLTRDGRMKERKKYGLRGARRGTQFSKR
ncbi:MAG: 30S ribosomal protein S9 [Pirellulales bacterium]|nr:30S ribosomal protein S9 [Pirellulales bacterium]